MSIISLLFGDKHSSKRYALSAEEVEMIVSQNRISSLSQQEVRNVENAIIAAEQKRGGWLSLYELDKVLQKLEENNSISEIDRDAIMNAFKKHFEKK